MSLPRILVSCAVAWFLTASAIPSFAGAQRPAAEASGPAQAPAEDQGPSERTPQGAVRAYLEACRTNEYVEAARFLDLGNVPQSERAESGPRLARKLKVVLDQKIWVDLDALSTDPAGRTDDGLPDGVERIGSIDTARAGTASILIQRAPDGSVWRFAEDTVARIPGLYDEFGYGRIGELLPAVFVDARFLNVLLWQWIGLAVLALAAYFAAWILTGLLTSLLRPIAARSKTTLDDELLRLARQPVRFAIAVAFFATWDRVLHLAVPAQNLVDGLDKGLIFASVAWLLLRAVDVFVQVGRERLARAGKISAVAVLPLVEKTVKVALLVFATIVLLQNLGIDVTGLIAGLGIGGLALALAAQKTVENLFGGVAVIIDQPVRVGDFCRFGDKLGTVEDIGIRSTKIRTLDRTLTTIPNSEFSQMLLENFAARDKIRFFTVLGLRYETTGDQLRWVLAEIRRLLCSHPKVDPDPARIRFVGYGNFSLNLEIFAFVRTRDINEYLAVQEDLLLRIMDIVGASGTGFAFPSQTTYLARDSGNDPERTREAEQRVAAWRAEGRLPFPDYAPDTLGEFDRSLDYPPKGSAVAQHA